MFNAIIWYMYTALLHFAFLFVRYSSIHPLVHGLSALSYPLSPHFVTRWVYWLIGLALISWVFDRLDFHRLSLRLPYLGAFPFILLHLPLNFIFLSSLRLMYFHPSVDPWLIHFSGEFPGLEMSLVPDVVVPEAEQECEWSRNLVLNVCPGRALNLEPFSLMLIRRLPLDNGAHLMHLACSNCIRCIKMGGLCIYS